MSLARNSERCALRRGGRSVSIGTGPQTKLLYVRLAIRKSSVNYLWKFLEGLVDFGEVELFGVEGSADPVAVNLMLGVVGIFSYSLSGLSTI